MSLSLSLVLVQHFVSLYVIAIFCYCLIQKKLLETPKSVLTISLMHKWPGIFPVTVYGSFIPRHIFYRLHALCAYLRCLFVALCVLFLWPSFDVILADQVSVVIPVLKLKKSAKVVTIWPLNLCLDIMSCLILWFFSIGCILLSFSRLVAGSTYNFHQEDVQKANRLYRRNNNWLDFIKALYCFFEIPANI